MNWNILLIWPSWAWKTTVSKEIIKTTKNHRLFVADTSRNLRLWEQDWIDYNFISSEKIIEQSNLNIDYLMEEYFKNYYWYNLVNFNQDKRVVLTPWINVAEEVLRKKEYFWFTISILLSIDIETFNERLKNRWESEDEINKRKKSLELLDFSSKVDLVINWNDQLIIIKQKLLEILKI